MNYCSVKPRNKLRSIPVPNIILMRNNYNQLHLFTPNRLELQLLIACTSVGHAALVTTAVLIPTLQKSERLTNHTRSYTVNSTQFGERTLPANPQPSNDSNSWPTNCLSSDSSVTTTSKPHKSGFTPGN